VKCVCRIYGQTQPCLYSFVQNVLLLHPKLHVSALTPSHLQACIRRMLYTTVCLQKKLRDLVLQNEHMALQYKMYELRKLVFIYVALTFYIVMPYAYSAIRDLVIFASTQLYITDVGNLRHACQAWHVERFSMAR
jgi:hypothetical protein